jgi:L-threonylcarbamoyladenylate synthase
VKYETKIGDSLEEAAGYLREGHLVAIPTETVYGLAGNALDALAVVRIFEAKERPLYNPLIVHAADIREVRQLSREWYPGLDRLATHLWPGPLSLLLDRHSSIPDLVTAGLPKVALRIPDHALTRQLIRLCGFPLAAPSANLFSRISPTTPEHVYRQLEGRIPYILDGGPCAIGLESTIVGKNEEGQWTIYRPGAYTREDLAAFLGQVHLHTSSGKTLAPGMLPLHYAPSTPLLFGDLAADWAPPKNEKAGMLRYRDRHRAVSHKVQQVLAPDGDLRTAARNLYATLHHLDRLGLDVIYAEPVPDEGIGKAINDRLRRAGESASLPA